MFKCILVRFQIGQKLQAHQDLEVHPSSLALDSQAGSLEFGYHRVPSRLEQEVVVAEEVGKVVCYLVLVLMNLSQSPCSMGPRKCLRGRRLKSLYRVPGARNYNKVSRNLR